MPWRPIADSGIGFVPSLPDGVTISGSTITCQRLDTPGDQSWSLQLAKAVPVRVNFLAFNSNGRPESGEFMFNGQIVDNQGGADQWQPNPVQSPSPSSVVVYSPGEQSDYPQDSYTATVEIQTGEGLIITPPSLRMFWKMDGSAVLWVRGEDGPVDLSQSDLTFEITSYGSRRLADFPAEGDAFGKVSISVPAVFYAKYERGTYRYRLVDSVMGVLAVGVLEVA